MKRSVITYESGERIGSADLAIMQVVVSVMDGVFNSIRLSWARIEHEFFVFVRWTVGSESGRMTLEFQSTGLLITSSKVYKSRRSSSDLPQLAVDYGDPEMLDAIERYVLQIGAVRAHCNS